MKKKHTQLVAIHEFIKTLEGLKKLLRHSWLSDGRRESVAEHTWRMAMMAMTLADVMEEKIDLAKVVKMVLVHDVAEILAGDVVWFKDTVKEKYQKEKAALEKLTQELPNKLSTEFTQLWQEFEERKTYDAKFAVALDKLEVLIQHNQASLDTWEDIEFEINYWYAYDEVKFSKVLTQFRDLVLLETIEKIENDTF